MPAWGRENWRYGILKRRWNLNVSATAQAVSGGCPEPGTGRAARSAPVVDQPGRPRGAVPAHRRGRVRRLLRAGQEGRPALYLTSTRPRTDTRCTVLALSLPWAKLVAELAQRCEKLAQMEDTATFKAELGQCPPASRVGVRPHGRCPTTWPCGAQPARRPSMTHALPPRRAWTGPRSSSTPPPRMPGPQPRTGTLPNGGRSTSESRSRSVRCASGTGTSPAWMDLCLGPWPCRSPTTAGSGAPPCPLRPLCPKRVPTPAASRYEVNGQGRYVRLLFENGSQRAGSRGRAH